MAKLDRLEWVSGTAFRAYGIRFGIRASRATELAELRETFPPGWKPIEGSAVVDHLYSLRLGSHQPNLKQFHLLYSGTRRIARSLELPPVIQALESDLQLVVALGAPRRLFVHAGVVGWRNQAIVFPGRSFSGKTTLVAAMVRAGARYYSDEFAVLDQRGRVHPYHKPLSMRDEEGDEPRRVAAEELGGRLGSRALPVGLVVLSEYQSTGKWRPLVLSPAQAVLALLGNTVSARFQPRVVLDTLKVTLRRATVLRSERGEVDEVVDTILSHLDPKNPLIPIGAESAA
jgi:hypothetical protein